MIKESLLFAALVLGFGFWVYRGWIKLYLTQYKEALKMAWKHPEKRSEMETVHITKTGKFAMACLVVCSIAYIWIKWWAFLVFFIVYLGAGTYLKTYVWDED